jgi:hypothetical protein
MEITKVNRKGISRISDTLRIKYDIPVSASNQVHSLTGNILKEDNPAGFFNADSSGVLGFSLDKNNGLSWEERKILFETAVNDAMQAFTGDIQPVDSNGDAPAGQELNVYQKEEIPDIIIVEGKV